MHCIAKVLCKGNPFHGPFSQLLHIYIYIYTYVLSIKVCIYIYIFVCLQCIHEFPFFGLPFLSVSILCFWFTPRVLALWEAKRRTKGCLDDGGYTQKEREREGREEIVYIHIPVYIYI